ncbi:DUF6221 family protein [Streptomyces sp. NPDC088789]|uniref:DUF6221 family protein n=1 Tax=Streptomyces sp. NPDC088789 TaxID=3365899 RepID=UPI003815FDF0
MDDLVQWLRAQLDEERQAAEEALKNTTTTRRMIGGQWVEDTIQPPEWRRSVWDPARVLREIDAKRDLLVFAEGIYAYGDTFERGVAARLEETLRLFALPYADRPGYREEWRP